MLADMECKSCGASFELDTETILDDPENFKCPNCRNKIAEGVAEQFAAAIDDLVAQLSLVRKKFSFTLTLDADDLELFGEEEDEEDEEWDAEEELGEDPYGGGDEDL
jgi:uncharacterized paraquat-inducible protein A